MKYLIFGLGNIGIEYEQTRHNIGFKIVEQLAKKKETSFVSEKLAKVANFKYKGRNFYLIKPTTYMNRSGKAIKYWTDKLKCSIDNILVVVDDIALPFGQIRLKGKGSDGGHNGLKDIQNTLGTNQYARLRFGIGNSFYNGEQIKYVLGEWTKEEEESLNTSIDKSVDAILSFGTIGLPHTMNQYN